ncbi:hypothetical protein QE152_g37266 [Popillia japonica]|uniref:Uncharacterized protein n=1 Tax=Popillia japonica TaxID=7064 RepID=A0AAW1IAR2_POPJA
MLIKRPAYVTEGSIRKSSSGEDVDVEQKEGVAGETAGENTGGGKRGGRGVQQRHCVKNKNTCIKKRTSILFLLKLPHNDNQACPGSERV